MGEHFAMNTYESPELSGVKLEDPVLAGRIESCMTRTIPSAAAKAVETGRIDAFDLEHYHGERHIYWDSDVAKILEGIAYALRLRPDEKLAALFKSWTEKIISCQCADGYLNSYFTAVCPEDRWKTLSTRHELYCAGHLMEAAVAGRDLPGGGAFLDAVCRYADLICDTFGLEKGKRRGWPGHEEIELALVKLYRATGNRRYLDQAAYFIDDRGTEPNVFAAEEPPAGTILAVQQADKPVREMTEAYGHAVRAVYLYAGMADVARETDDGELLNVCEKLFDSIRTRKMYVTGGIGSSFQGERFTRDYDLFNGSMMYAESCAAMGLCQLALRLFNITGKYLYMDVLETALYNGALSGISLAGDDFFYTNYLEVDDNLVCYNSGSPVRQKWFNCSCCPTSFCRFIPQMGRFIYSVAEDEISVNIPAANTAELRLKDRSVKLKIEGNYPYSGNVRIVVETAGAFTLRLRIPGWCRAWRLAVGGERYTEPVIKRDWNAGEAVEFDLDMPVDVVYSDPRVTGNLGRAALRRGPVVYALEEIDQSCPVRELVLCPDRPMSIVSAPDLPAGTPAIRGTALREVFPEKTLYTVTPPRCEETVFTAVPYALWQNRGKTNMCVWNRILSSPPRP